MGYSTVQKAILMDSHWRQLSGHESFLILYLKGKYRSDVKGGGSGPALNVNLTLSVNKSVFQQPLTIHTELELLERIIT